jgi:multidrug efflux pump subunit AcrA (membrane-fusion protein)
MINTPVNAKATLEQQAEMLPQHPPPAIVTWIAWLLVLLFITVAVAAVWVRLPDTVRCPFVIVSMDGSDPVQSPILAEVRDVKAMEGQEVEKGAPLFVLRSTEIRSWQTQLQTMQEDQREVERRRSRTEDLYKDQIEIKSEEIQQLEQEVAFREKHTKTSRDFLARTEILAKDGISSQVELLRFQLDLAQSEKETSIAQKAILQANLERKQIETERLRHRSEEESELLKIKVRMEALNRQLEDCEGDQMTIRAPYRAVVLSVPQRAAGSVVQGGQELCQLARVEGPLRARLQAQETGLPRLVTGQKVRLFFEAFPYQRYGTITGKLEWISPAAVTAGSNQSFLARANLDQLQFHSGPVQKPLRVGMRGEARILVGSRTPLEYAFEPIRQLREQLRP